MIYFITARDLGRVKIGYSAVPRHRFSKIQSDSPTRLKMERVCEGEVADEAALHQRFSAYRLRGEWFTLAPEIEQHMATLPVEPEKKPSITKLIIAATGLSKGTVSQILSPKYPNKLTIPICISVYRNSGVRIGALETATDHEIDVLEKFCGRFSK